MAITGAGTETDPYLVSTAEELRACLESNDSGDYPGQYIQLANDIDKVGDKLSSTTITSPKILNGDNHKIRNIFVNQRLFCIYNTPVTFNNIHFENIDVVAKNVRGVLIGAYVTLSSININIHTCTFHVHLAELQEYDTMFNFEEANFAEGNIMLFQKCEFMFFINEKSTVTRANFVGFTCYAGGHSPGVHIGVKQSRIVFDYSNYLITQSQMYEVRIFDDILGTGTPSDDTVLEQTYVIIKGNDKDYSLCIYDGSLLFTDTDKDLRLKYIYFFADDKVKSSLLSYDYSSMSTDITQRNYAIQVLVSTPVTQNQEESGAQGVYYLTYDQIKNPDYLNSIYWYVNKEGE